MSTHRTKALLLLLLLRSAADDERVTKKSREDGIPPEDESCKVCTNDKLIKSSESSQHISKGRYYEL
jgi:hypothetical protein